MKTNKRKIAIVDETKGEEFLEELDNLMKKYDLGLCEYAWIFQCMIYDLIEEAGEIGESEEE